MNSGQEMPGDLVISGGDAAEVLEPAKAAFDDISAFVDAFVEAMDDNTVRFIGDYRLGAATNNFAAKVVAVIPFFGEERAHGWGARQDIGPRSDIGILDLGSDAARPADRADRSAHGFLSCSLRASGRLLDYASPF